MNASLPRRPAVDAARPGLTACRLCAGETLGQTDPRPDGQLGRLEDLALRGVADLTLVDCLDRCERGDVVVARPSRAGRRGGGRPVWLERLAGEDATAALAGWLADGGPGAAPLPQALRGCRLRRSPDARPGDAPL